MNKLEEYIEKYRQIHTGEKFVIKKSGTKQYIHDHRYAEVFGDGVEFVKKVFPYINNLIQQKGRAVNILDYGCGQSKHTYDPNYIEYDLLPEFKGNTIFSYFKGMIQSYYCYDPAVPRYSQKPPDGSLFDAVVVADVMEHVPEEYVVDVISDASKYCKPDGFIMFTISGNPAFTHFINDDNSIAENAHITLRSFEYWIDIVNSNVTTSFVVMYTNNDFFKETNNRINCKTYIQSTPQYQIPHGLNRNKIKKIDK